MPFNVEVFLNLDSADREEQFCNLKKEEYLAIAEYFELPATTRMKKGQIRELVAQALIEKNYLKSFEFSLKDDSSEQFKFQLEMKRLEVELKQKEMQMQMQMQMQENENERQEKERQEKEKERAFELEKLKLEQELRLRELAIQDTRSNTTSTLRSEQKFDAAKNIRLVPKFVEKSVDKFFPQFEKVAENLKWPREVWPTLLQSVLIGKAAEIYSALSIEDSSNYDKVKKSILKGYELVPEAYRQKFRNYKKFDSQTFVEFAREKEDLCDQWLRSKNIDKNFDNFRQLILIEEFKRCVHQDLKTHLDDKDVKTINQAAVLSDSYELCHKKSFVSTSFKGGSFNKHDNFDKKSALVSQSISNTDSKQNSRSPPVKGFMSSQKSGQSDNTFNSGSAPQCVYCKKRGHVVSECFKLKRKQELDQIKASAFLSNLKYNQPLVCSLPDNQVSKSSSVDFMEEYKPFMSQGFVSINDSSTDIPIQILRDTGASQTILLEGVLPLSEKTFTGKSLLLQGVECGVMDVPLHEVHLKSDLITGPVIVGVRPTLPIQGVSLLLGNDLAGGKVVADPIVYQKAVYEELQTEDSDVYPACAITRAMAKKRQTEENFENQALQELISQESKTDLDDLVDLSDTFLADSDEVSDQDPGSSDISISNLHENDKELMGRKQLIMHQNKDPELISLLSNALPPEEAAKVGECFYLKSGILMRKWRPPNAPVDQEWQVFHQIVVPTIYRGSIISLAHDTPMAGHLGINKTYQKILNYFYWPGMKRDVCQYCKSCHVCQMVGKPNQKIPPAPLQPITAFEEPFSRVLIDCVGPLPKTKTGNQYLLTIMCTSTRFPEAIPLRNIKAKTIVKALAKFFCFVGIPKNIQSDQGSNFMSGLFQQVMHELGIKQFKSSAYHPESQGALERFHQTLKSMMKKYCFEYQKDWDESVHLVLFAAREAVQESLGFSPYQLVFGHTVRGPLKLMKEKWLTEATDLHLLDYVSSFKEKLFDACKLAQENLKYSQNKMKLLYDANTKDRTFKKGDKVLVFLPLPGHALQARYFGPYVIESKLNDLNYVVLTPGRQKEKRVCHVNMLKKYVDRDDNVKPVSTINNVVKSSCDHVQFDKENSDEQCDFENEQCVDKNIEPSAHLINSDILSDLDSKLKHLGSDHKDQLSDLIHEYSGIFGDVPTQTTIAFHDVDVDDAKPIKQHPYRMNPVKLQYLRTEVQYMLDNDIIEPSNSEWSSPCILVPKPDGSYRMCTDYRKVNIATKTDSYPIPRLEDCIDRIGSAKYVSKLDLLKGYYAVPLTERAKNISAFVTPDGLWQYKVTPFGMKNSGATFQRMMNNLLHDLHGCEAYIDDVVIYSDTWEEHLQIMHELFRRLKEANLTVNLCKTEFCHATVEYLGHIVSGGSIKPFHAKVEAVLNFPTPTNKKMLMRFLGMVGFYRKFCQNFSIVVVPLTNLLQKRVKFEWDKKCDDAFNKIKSVLVSGPVLCTPDFTKQFKLNVDACDVGVGSVLYQEDDDNVDKIVGYFSKKLTKSQRNYSTIEKECLALLLSLQHFDVYLNVTMYPILCYTDHNPLIFLHKMTGTNQRLTRWSLIMQEYNIIVKHIKGKDNVIADALSRV